MSLPDQKQFKDLSKSDIQEIIYLVARTQRASTLEFAKLTSGNQDLRIGDFRIVNPDVKKLAKTRKMDVTGFRAQRITNIPPKIDQKLREITERIIQQLPPDVLSYSYTLDQETGLWTNLVLSNINEEERQRPPQISTLPDHIYASQELAPRAYENIRLYKGRLEKGLNIPNLTMHQCTYFVYENNQLQSRNIFRL